MHGQAMIDVTGDVPYLYFTTLPVTLIDTEYRRSIIREGGTGVPLIHSHEYRLRGEAPFSTGNSPGKEVVMAKTDKGKKIVPVKPYIKKVDGAKVSVKPHRRSTPN